MSEESAAIADAPDRLGMTEEQWARFVDSFEGLRQRAAEMELFGVPVRVASLEDLIRMKQAAGRLQDQLHLVELEALRRLR
jgi:hypothetical protein